jgi:hypothetical protein
VFTVGELIPENMNTALVVVIGGIFAQCLGTFLTWLQSRKNGKLQAETKHAMNSRLDELLALAQSSAHAKGRLEGIEEQKRRTASGDDGQPDVTK